MLARDPDELALFLVGAAARRRQSRHARPHRRGDRAAEDDGGGERRTRSAPTCSSAISCATKSASPRRSTPMTRRSSRTAAAGLPERWTLFYDRGVALERSGQWERAEADLLHALELKPDQPLVLNYLGYSWIDRGENLDRGMKMIEKAVELRPEDGYIVDSLGWAHYRLGDYAGAVAIPRKGDRAGAGGPDDQRPSRRRLLADRAARSRRAINGAGRCSSGRRRTRSSRSRPSSNGWPRRRSGSGGARRLSAAGRCAASARLRPGEGQSLPACRRAARRRLSPARQPGRLCRYRRPDHRRAGRRACR